MRTLPYGDAALLAEAGTAVLGLYAALAELRLPGVTDLVPAALLLKPFGLWGVRRTLRTVAGLGMPGSEEFLEGMALTFRQFRPRREPLPVFSDAALRGLTMPVLVIAGEHDAMLDSRDTARRLADTVPHAVVRLLPGGGHSVVGQGEPVLAHLRRATVPGDAESR